MIGCYLITLAQAAVALFVWLLICASARHFGDESFSLASQPLGNSIEELGEGYLALIGTVDGNIHAIDDHLNLLWSTSSGGPLLSTGTAEKGKLIPSLDGSLYMHGTGESMRKTSVTARFLAEQSPFVTKDHIAFRTARQDSVIGFDVTDGSILRSKSHLIGDGGVLKIGTTKRVVPLYLGREDFLIKATDLKSSSDAFNISYSDIHPLLEDLGGHVDVATATLSSTSLFGLLDLNSDSSIVSTPEGFVYFLDEDGNAINDIPVELQSPVTHAFLLRLDKGAVRTAVRMPVRYNLNNWRKMSNLRPGKVKSSLLSRSSSTPRLLGSHQPLSIDDDTFRQLSVNSHYQPFFQEQQPSMVIIQQARDANNKDYTFAMEVPMPDNMGSSLRVDELLDDVHEHSHSKLPQLGQPSSFNSHKSKEAASNIDVVQPLESMKSMKIRRPVSSLQQSSKSFRTSTAGNTAGGIRSVSESLQLSEDVEAIKESGAGTFSSSDSYELQPLAESLIDISRNIHQIRGLHRLEAGKVNEEFWLPVLKKRTVANNLDPATKRNNQPLPLNSSRAQSVRPSSFLIRLLESLLRSLFLVVALFLSMLALFVVLTPRQSSLLEQPESIQLTVRLLLSILPQSRPYLSNVFPDLSRVERLPRSMFSLESLQQRQQSTSSSGASTGATESFVDENGMNVLKVGALNVYETVLGFGSHGTVVYSGTLNNRPVAVKRMLSILHKSAEREISLLIKSDGHPNVVRYFIKEERHDFIYLGLQLCIMSVKEFITKLQRQSQDNLLLLEEAAVGAADSDLVRDEVRLSLLQVAEGLAYLHSQRIVHRDIKPHNILCAPLQESSTVDEVLRGKQQLAVTSLSQLGNYVLKISDMGLSKQLERDSHSFSAMSLLSPTSRARRKSSATSSLGVASNDNISVNNTHDEEMQPDEVGTIGWQAPELITGRYISHLGSNSNRHVTISTGVITIDTEDCLTTPSLSVDQEKRRRTLNVDVFSLGCVFFYVLTAGGHPFGEWFQREANIAENKADLSPLASAPDAYELVEWMLHPDPVLRPTSQQVTGHPFFWTATKRLEFLTDFSDLLEKESAESPVILALESGAGVIFKLRWDRVLDKDLVDDMGKFRKYDPFSVRDLLRVIRNKRHHFHELPASLKAKIGSVPLGYCSYFEQRFPYLLLHCMSVAKKLLKNEKLLEPWLGRLLLGSLPSPSPTADISPPVVTVMTQFQSVIPVFEENSDDSPGLPLDYSGGDDETSIRASQQLPSRSSEQQQQQGSSEESGLENVIVWQGGALQQRLNSKAWWRDAGDFSQATSLLKQHSSNGAKRQRAAHLVRAAQDFKYRTRLCSHWEQSGGGICPMRKKGKCTFAHGPLELRVKDNRRDKWPRQEADSSDENISMKSSGGEDVLGAARAADYPRVDSEYEKRPPAPSLYSPVAPPVFYYPSYPSYPMFASVPPLNAIDNKSNPKGRE